MCFCNSVGHSVFGEAKTIPGIIMWILETAIKSSNMNTRLLRNMPTFFYVLFIALILEVLVIKFWTCFIEGSGWRGPLRI